MDDHMNGEKLKEIVQKLGARAKGILAMDESTGTIGKRLQEVHVENTEENRRAYREILITAPGLGKHISGAILYDETLRQKALDGTPFPMVLERQGILSGIKVDKGAMDLAGFPNEKITEGLDGLREKLKEYAALGAQFAKWRAVIGISEGMPTQHCIDANAHALARYAALCQEQHIVPIVEPEVLMDGKHSIDRSYDATDRMLHALFVELKKHHVFLGGLILKPNMVISGLESEHKADRATVVRMTLDCLRANVPSAVPVVAFLSGGQSDEDATMHLNEMNKFANAGVPWRLTFSYGRGMQREALKVWAGKIANKEIAQQLVLKRAEENGKASEGRI